MSDQNIEAKLALRVHPGARRNQVTSASGEFIDLKVAAPADKGKANAELVSFLAEALGIARSDIRILRGDYSHNKLVAVSGLKKEDALSRLASLVAKGKGGAMQRKLDM